MSAVEDDPQRADELLPIVYEELRKLAAARLANEWAGQTLQATALVHEAYLRLLDDGKSLHWNSRGHFFGAAAEAMRRILVENARRKSRLKRGGDLVRCDLDIAEPVVEGIGADLLAVDEALTALSKEHPQKAELVKLRYFAGLPLAEAAAVLDISSATADRHWRYARAWLAKRLREA